MTWRRRIAASLAVPVVIVGGMLVGPGTAAAESSSELTAEYPWPHNGCTNTVDNPALISFTYACNHHDGCYAGHWADRGTCDAWFRNDMIDACNRRWYFNYEACIRAAWVYWGAVRILGEKYYQSEGELVRISAPMTVA